MKLKYYLYFILCVICTQVHAQGYWVYVADTTVVINYHGTVTTVDENMNFQTQSGNSTSWQLSERVVYPFKNLWDRPLGYQDSQVEITAVISSLDNHHVTITIHRQPCDAKGNPTGKEKIDVLKPEWKIPLQMVQVGNESDFQLEQKTTFNDQIIYKYLNPDDPDVMSSNPSVRFIYAGFPDQLKMDKSPSSSTIYDLLTQRGRKNEDAWLSYERKDKDHDGLTNTFIPNIRTFKHKGEITENTIVDFMVTTSYEIRFAAASSYQLKWDIETHYYYRFVKDGEADITIVQDASADEGESTGGQLPPWMTPTIISVTVGYVIYKTTTGRKGKKGKKSKKKKEDPKSVFQLILQKDFGNTLLVGDDPQWVGVRVEETTEKGEKIDRPDLTQLVSIDSGDFIEIKGTPKFNGKYMLAQVVVPETTEAVYPEKEWISFRISSAEFTFTNKIRFRIQSNCGIIFADEGLTFVAYDNATQYMEIIVSGLGDKPQVSFTLDGDKSSFKDATLELVDPTCHLYRFTITECSKTRDFVPGMMDLCNCTIQATNGFTTVEETFGIYNFYQGLRMEISALGAYLVPSQEDPGKYSPVEEDIYLYLYTYDPESRRVKTSIPDDDPVFKFIDIEGSEILADENGEEVKNPCERLQFGTRIDNVDETTNQMHYKVSSHTGFLVAPNRSRAKVIVSMAWGGKTFTAEREVSVISMPYRQIKSDADLIKFEKLDAQCETNLTRIEYELWFNEDLTEMRPILHKVQALRDGYDPAFGYYMPDYERIVEIYKKYYTGAYGSVAANREVMGLKEQLSEAAMMTVGDINESGLGIALRIGCGILTSGQSEFVFAPLSALGHMKKYVDNGGDSIYEGFKVGVKEFLKDELIGAGIGLGAKIGTVVGAKVLKGSYNLIKAGVTAAASKVRIPASSWASFKYAKNLSNAAKTLKSSISRAQSSAKKTILSVRKNLDNVSEFLQRDVAYVSGRRQGLLKVKKFEQAMKAGRPQSEIDELVQAIQKDKHAMNQLKDPKGAFSNVTRAQFNHEMDKVYDKAIGNAQKRLSQANGGLPVRVKQATGNNLDDLRAGRTVSMDKDVTFEMYKDGKWVDIREEVAAPIYENEFFKVCRKVDPVDAEAAKEFAKQMDQSVVDMFGNESYGTWDDLMRLMNASRAGEKLDNIVKVTKTMKFKSEHWFKLGEEARQVGNKLLAKGEGQAALYAFQQSEALIEEGVRQATKQFDRIILPRIENALSKGKNVDYERLIEKVEILKSLGLGKNGCTGTTVAEMEIILEKGYKTNAIGIVNEITDLLKKLDNMV